MNDPLREALDIQRAAAAQGFDWHDPAGVWDKLAEEIAELRAAGSAAEQHDEFGDLLFMMLNLSRHLGIDPAEALRAACLKFRRRYALVEASLEHLPPLGSAARLQAMEALWQQAKALERRADPPAPAGP